MAYNAAFDALVGEEGEYGETLDFDDESEEDEDGSDEEEDDDDETPRRRWQAHLTEVRQRAKGKMKANASDVVGGSPGGLFQARLTSLKGKGVNQEDSDIDEEDGRDDFDEQFGWYEDDGDLVDDIQVSKSAILIYCLMLKPFQKLLDENDVIVKGRNRKGRNALFNSIRDGDFSSSPAKKRA